MANDSKPINDGTPWTRDQVVLAFELYCRIPFQRTKASEPQVKALARLIGRTGAAVARKLGNLGAFDPRLQAQNISGLSHGSKLDRTVWDEFHQDWTGLVSSAHRLRASLSESSDGAPDPVVWPSGPSERTAVTKQRLHQAFFRDAVLSSYGGRCCITGLPLSRCLVAAHIVPWSVSRTLRADPTNGLCMSATFDRLFDAGLITVTADLNVRASPSILESANPVVAELITSRHDQPIIRPTRFSPNQDCLHWHETHVFKAA